MGESFDQCKREVEGTEDAHTLRMIGSLATALLNVLQVS
jgi:hypothetical protein